MRSKLLATLVPFLLLSASSFRGESQTAEQMPGTQPLTLQGDLSAQMVTGIDRFLGQQTQSSLEQRASHWKLDFASPAAYANSLPAHRERLRKLIGAVDVRMPVKALELVGSTATAARLGETELLTVEAVRWPVFEGVSGEGLWLKPKQDILARVVAVPDADQTPEMLAGLAPGISGDRQWGRRLAENGCEVLIPVLIDRQDTWSGNERISRFTNQPHREWIYRQAYELGRHIIGYEVQKVQAALDFFELENAHAGSRKLPLGIAGYAEGGLVALYTAALDSRVEATLVSGYFDSRQRLWEEPIYRNLFGWLREFGDAELATLIAPRALVVEHAPAPKVDGPPKPRDGRRGAAPGKLKTADFASVEAEFERARTLLKPGASADKSFDRLKLISGTEGMATGPVSDRALAALLNGLGIPGEAVKRAGPAIQAASALDPAERQRRQLKQLEDHTQRIFRRSEYARGESFWKAGRGKSASEWPAVSAPFRKALQEDVIGWFGSPALPSNPRSRKLSAFAGEAKNWTGYEVVLDVYPDVFAWGYLLVPSGIKEGERRPVVVCQHGLEGVPADTVTGDTNSQAFRYYKAFSARLAERGYVVFAPHNPYRGEDRFRVLQRKANPLGKSLFSIITAQHERILDWLGELPFVDPKRIGFYGLSYGGKTAMRVPAILERYALSICSADFNEWVEKNVSVDFPGSYMFTGEYEMPEWDLGHSFNYAEMAALIAPRPFMVERGHDDGVGIDEWVAYEYAKVRRFYDQLQIGERTTIEYFDGPHTIHGKGTFEFLQKHLKGSSEF